MRAHQSSEPVLHYKPYLGKALLVSLEMSGTGRTWGAAKEGWPRNPPPNDMVVHR